MTVKWVKWEPDIAEEAEEAFGEGPFPVIKQTDDTVVILIEVEMPKRNVTTALKNERLERDIKQSIGGGSSKKHKCSCQATEVHPLAGYISTANKIKSPYTSQFKEGQKVITPEGLGNITKVNFKTITVNIPTKGNITWEHQYIEKAGENGQSTEGNGS